jgi:hypothetical protein
MRTCAGLRTVRRLLLYLPLLVTLVPFIPGEALAKGGTDVHSLAPEFPAVQKTVRSVTVIKGTSSFYYFGGCGHGRYRVASTHMCRGPADR